MGHYNSGRLPEWPEKMGFSFPVCKKRNIRIVLCRKNASMLNRQSRGSETEDREKETEIDPWFGRENRKKRKNSCSLMGHTSHVFPD